MQEMLNAIEAGSTPAVALWINWMGLVFILSILFVWKYKPARFVLAAILLTGPLGYLIWALTDKIHLIGISHLLIWTPLLVYLYLKEIKSPEFKVQSVYGIWILLLSATIVVSLVFDVRDVFLVLTGAK